MYLYIVVVDVYAGWAGPCEAMQSIFKKLKSELGAIITFYRVTI